MTSCVSLSLRMPSLLQVALLEGRRQQFLIFMAGITCTERKKKKGTEKKKIHNEKKEKDIERGKIPELYMFP